MFKPDINIVKQYFIQLQERICKILANEEEHEFFREDAWEYAQGDGGGETRILENGKVIERGGVNFSHIQGVQLPLSATVQRCEVAGCFYEATGISMVVHPVNPYAPTMHANLRFFLVEKDNHPVWWFGGGFDLTPYYGFEEDCQHWHGVAKQICEPYGPDVYANYKRWCDEYFYLKHRHEPRGIGGIFFDDLQVWGFERTFSFVQAVGDHILPAYLPILQRRKATPYGERERQFQLYRRGRYVEFNLVYDRGTLFGLQSGGRVESILMSMPPHVDWRYHWEPLRGSEEEKLYKNFLIARDWV